MRVVTLNDILSDGASLANVPFPTTSTAIDLTTATRWANKGIAELFNLVVSAAGDSAYRKATTITTAQGQIAYPLPNDFHELRSAVAYLDAAGNDRRTLTRFTLAERPYLMSATPGWNGEPFKYMESGKTTLGGSDPGSIEFLPPPSTGTVIELLYTFAPTTLANLTDTLDGFAGFDDYATVFWARRAAMKTEQRERAAELLAELGRIQANTLGTMRSRDAAHAPRVNMSREPWSPRLSRWSRWR